MGYLNVHKQTRNFCPQFQVFVHNFMFLFTFFRKLYEHFRVHLNVHKQTRNFFPQFQFFVHNFKFLSTFSKKLYEHFWVHLNVHKQTQNFCPQFHFFVYNFMFLSTFSRKLYEHLNMFIRIGHVSWHLLNMFLSIFVTILSFFISTNQNHFKIKKTKLYYFQCRQQQ